MSLVVPNSGELEALRTLINQQSFTQTFTDAAPRNLVLKLFSSNTIPEAGDVPSQTAYFEPYNSSGLLGYGSVPGNGYPQVVNIRENQDYSQNYGILLNGSRWQVSTASDPIGSGTGSGVAGGYTISLTNYSGQLPQVGSIVGTTIGNTYTAPSGVGGNVLSPTLVSAVSTFTNVVGTTVSNGNGTITINIQLVGTVSGSVPITGGITTASYPQQTFTFTGAAGNVYGYHLTRANNLPTSIKGVVGQAVASNGTTVSKSSCVGANGNSYFTVPLTSRTTTTYTGTAGTSVITVDATSYNAVTTSSFYGVTQTSTSGSGSTASFNVSLNFNSYVVTLVSGGTGYVVGERVTIAGTSLGGATTANDLVITVVTLSGSAIATFTVSGVAVESLYGHTISGTGIPNNTKIIGKGSSNQLYLNRTLTATAAGNATIVIDNTYDLTLGMIVSNTGTSSFTSGTTVVGIDRYTGGLSSTSTVYISSPLTADISSGNSNQTVSFNFSQLSTGSNTSFTGYISGNTLTLSGLTQPVTFAAGGVLVGSGVTGFPSITLSTGSAGTNGATYTISGPSQGTIGSSGSSVTFYYQVPTSHGLVAGDVIYIDKGTSTNLVPNAYTVFSTPTSSTFTTTPSLTQASGAGQVTGTATLYDNILYAERFTNGPYSIQNNGDQIKVTLNLSLN
jgi:hypothetical protein